MQTHSTQWLPGARSWKLRYARTMALFIARMTAASTWRRMDLPVGLNGPTGLRSARRIGFMFRPGPHGSRLRQKCRWRSLPVQRRWKELAEYAQGSEYLRRDCRPRESEPRLRSRFPVCRHGGPTITADPVAAPQPLTLRAAIELCPIHGMATGFSLPPSAAVFGMAPPAAIRRPWRIS